MGMHPGTAQAGLDGTINALDPGWRDGLGAPTRAPSPALLQCPRALLWLLLPAPAAPFPAWSGTNEERLAWQVTAEIL